MRKNDICYPPEDLEEKLTEARRQLANRTLVYCRTKNSIIIGGINYLDRFLTKQLETTDRAVILVGTAASSTDLRNFAQELGSLVGNVKSFLSSRDVSIKLIRDFICGYLRAHLDEGDPLPMSFILFEAGHIYFNLVNDDEKKPEIKYETVLSLSGYVIGVDGDYESLILDKMYLVNGAPENQIEKIKTIDWLKSESEDASKMLVEILGKKLIILELPFEFTEEQPTE